MHVNRSAFAIVAVAALAGPPTGAAGAAPRAAAPDRRLEALKREAAADVDGMRAFTQQMVDALFSFGELGFQEFETSRHLVAILRENGFQVREGVSFAW